MDLAELTTEDPHAGLPEAEELGTVEGDLQLFSDEIAGLATEERSTPRSAPRPRRWRSIRALPIRKARLSIRISAGACLPIRAGFAGSYRSTYCSISAVPVATQNGSMERDYWFTIARDFRGLEDPETVGRKAAERALRRLGAVKVETQRVPWSSSPALARSLLGNIFEAVEGRAIYRKASFLAGKLGEKIAAERDYADRRRHNSGPVRQLAVRR